jgi:R3H domain protein
MEKQKFIGKTYEEAVNNAMISLQENEENLIIKKLSEEKGGLFKASKVEIEVIEKRNILPEIKNYIVNILKLSGFTVNIEVKNKETIPTLTIYSDNDSLIIGRNGKNLQALSIITNQYIQKLIGKSYKFILDVNSYKEKRDEHLENLARKIAREVAKTKIEVKMDSMNSYERRVIHNALTNNKKVYTESVGEEPNRCVVVKPKKIEE